MPTLSTLVQPLPPAHHSRTLRSSTCTSSYALARPSPCGSYPPSLRLVTRCMSSDKVAGLKKSLLQLLGDGSSGATRTDARTQVEQVVQDLCTLNPTHKANASALLPGRWRLLTTYKPSTEKADFFSLEDWRKYFFDGGPSPVQSLVVGNTTTVSRVYQVLVMPPNGRFLNVVDFSKEAGGVLVIEAKITGLSTDTKADFRFSGGFFLFTTFLGQTLDKPLKVPYPVPFDLLGDRALGGLDTLFLDADLRISVGNKGSIFVLTRDDEEESISLQGY